MKLQRITLAIALIPTLLILLYTSPPTWDSFQYEFSKSGTDIISWFLNRYLVALVFLGLIAFGSAGLLSHFWKDSSKHPIILGVLSVLIQVVIIILLLIWIGTTGAGPGTIINSSS